MDEQEMNNFNATQGLKMDCTMLSTNQQQQQRCHSTSGETKWFLGDVEGVKENLVFVLAGNSADQKSLLNQVGIEPKVVPVDHQQFPPLTSPVEELVEEESAAKAQKAATILTEKRAYYDIVIGCEAAILLDEEVIGQPKDADDALSILLSLNNRWHTVFTGVTIIDSVGRMKQFHVKTRVEFGDISEERFREYIKTGECFNRVGAYNVHGKGVEFVESAEGALPGMPARQLKLKIRELLSSPKPSTAQAKNNRPIPFPRTIFPSDQTAITNEELDPFGLPITPIQLVTSTPTHSESFHQNLTTPSFDSEVVASSRAEESRQKENEPVPVKRRFTTLAQTSNSNRSASPPRPDPSTPPRPNHSTPSQPTPSRNRVQRRPSQSSQYTPQHHVSHNSTHRSQPQPSQFGQQMPPRDEYMSTFYRATGRPGLSDWRRIGVEPELHKDETQHDYKYSSQDDWGGL